MTLAPKGMWFKFSLRDLFLATTMIAIGTGGMLVVETTYTARTYGLYVTLGLWFASGALIGAGILFPFKKAALGAIVGYLITWLISSVLMWA